MYHKNVWCCLHQLFGIVSKTLRLRCPPPIGDLAISPFVPACCVEPRFKCCGPGLGRRIGIGNIHESADTRHSLLRARRERPSRRCCNSLNEIASSHCLAQSSGPRRLWLTAIRLQQGYATDEMGSEVSLHGSNPEPLMSALGHKQTFGSFIAMSAIPPKADIRQRDLDVRFVPEADIALRDDFSSAARPDVLVD